MMKGLRLVVLIALGVSCHLDKLLSGGGGAAAPSHAAPAGLVFASVPHAPRAGQLLGPVRVSVVDSAGRPVAGADTVTVSVALGANPGNATLHGTLSSHPARGVATFSDLWVDRATSGYRLTATASGLPGTSSDTFTVAPGVATRLTFTTEPSSVNQGDVVAPPVVVAAFDSLDNKATDFTGVVRLALRQSGSEVMGALTGTTSTTAVAGVATFRDLRINNVGSGYTLTAAFGDAAPAVQSARFDVTVPGPPPARGYLRFTDQPAITQAGNAIPPVRVTVYDASGNQDASYTGDIVLSIGFNPSGGTLTGGGAVSMHPSLGGVAEWDNLAIATPGDGYVLHATASGLADAFSDPVDMTAGPPPPPNGADGLGFFQQPSTTRAGAVISAIRVAALNGKAGGTVVTAYSGPIWISLDSNPTGATLSGTRHLFAVNGFVTFSDLTIDKPGTGYTLRVTAWPLNYIESTPFNVTP